MHCSCLRERPQSHHPPQAQPEVVSLVPNTDPHPTKGSVLKPTTSSQPVFFFSKQGQGREKAIVYKRHIILLSIFFTVIGTEPAALLHQELEKFKRWSKERAKQALERREAHLHSITKNHFISKPCPLCSGRRTLRFSHL